MEYLPRLGLLVGTWAVAMISPGPDFAVIVRYATAYSRRDGLFVALGVTCAISLWIIGSMLGLAVLLIRFSWLTIVLRVAGSLFLTYLGIQTIRHAHHPAPLPLFSTEASEISHARAAWRAGFLTNISNPKAVAFFSSLFILILPANPPHWIQVASILSMLSITLIWYCIVAYFFSLKPVIRFYGRMKRWIDYATGGIFIALALRLALEK